MERTKKAQKVVCDSGPIIHLDELNSLPLLRDFKEILISRTVSKEVTRYRPSALRKLTKSYVLSPESVPVDRRLLILCQMFSLDAGEIGALALMEKNPLAIFLTDDASARLVADQMGFKVHRTIGILIRSIRRKQMNPEETLRILEEIPSKTTLYIKPSLLDEIILTIKKKFNI